MIRVPGHVGGNEWVDTVVKKALENEEIGEKVNLSKGEGQSTV